MTHTHTQHALSPSTDVLYNTLGCGTCLKAYLRVAASPSIGKLRHACCWCSWAQGAWCAHAWCDLRITCMHAHLLANLFSTPLLMTSSITVAFFTATSHWVDVFTEVPTIDPRSPSWFITGSADPIVVCMKLGVFLLVCLLLFCSSITFHLLALALALLPFGCPFAEVFLEPFLICFGFCYPERQLQMWPPQPLTPDPFQRR